MATENGIVCLQTRSYQGDKPQSLTDQASNLVPASSMVYRTILPKTIIAINDEVVLEQQSNTTRLPKKSCQVIACVRANCALRTHSLYRAEKAEAARLNTRQKRSWSSETAKGGRQSQVDDPKSRFDLSIIQGGVDGLPALPLDGLHAPIFRQLFHRFFSQEYDRVVMILVPPPITVTEKAAAAQKKYDTLSGALSVPAYCLNYVAAMHYQIISRRDPRCLDKTTTVLHSKITTLLRDKLSSFDQEEMKDLVYIIFTLVMYEAADNRAHALPLHRRAVDHIVARKGGVHNMGMAVPYIINLDRIISLFTDLPPSYAPRVARAIRRPYKCPYVYGGFFESPASISIHQGVKEYSFEACRAVELIEKAAWTFGLTDSSSSNSADAHYLYFLRDCVANQYVHLNAGMAQTRDISRCILMATKVVDYVVLQHNYFVAIPIHLANRLHDMISDTINTAIFWNGQADILIWVLFVLLCMPSPWDKRSWALMLVKAQLNLKYLGGTWPVDWRERELRNLKTFVWSETRLNANFGKTCDELVYPVMNISHGG